MRTFALSCFVVLAVAACRTVPLPEAEAPPTTEIRDIDWSLIELEGAPAPQGMGGKPATLRLSKEDELASGFAGCNRISGRYALSGDTLTMGPLIMTRMACSEGMELEQRYAKALESTRRFRVTDGALVLIAGDTVLARLAQE